MNATTPETAPYAGANGSPQSTVDYVKNLPPEDKQAVFLALLREAIAENGDTGLLPVDDEDGKPFGYYVPPKAAAALYRSRGPKLTEEQEQEIDRRIAERGIPIAEVIADFKRQLSASAREGQRASSTSSN
jgi:hypothetical protein